MKMHAMRDSDDPGTAPGDPADITSMALRALGDADCVILAASGNASALEELVRRYTPKIYPLLYRLLGTREDAEDATQETFMRAYRNLSRFDPRRSFRAWLYAIAWNHARDVLRRRKRRSRALGPRPRSRFDTVSPATAEHEPPDRRVEAPSTAIERKEEDEWLHRALRGLRPQQRAVLVLREFAGLSYEDLAKFFACRVGTVKSRINRARLELKNELVKLRPDWFS